MNLLIVDDEPLARAELMRLFTELLPGFKGTEAATLPEARVAMLQEEFDGIFVDMDLGGSCGMDLVPSAKDTGTPVVITTAHERFAVEAFDKGVVDYLLKPVELPRLFRAISRLPKQRRESNEEMILLSDQSNCWPVKPEEILMVEADGCYSIVRLANKKPLTVSRSLKDIEQMLGEKNFIRANRSQVVNLRQVQVIHRQVSGKIVANLEGHGEIEFSRRQAQAFRSRFAA
jgi:two-component system LytT family response regulator